MNNNNDIAEKYIAELSPDNSEAAILNAIKMLSQIKLTKDQHERAVAALLNLREDERERVRLRTIDALKNFEQNQADIERGEKKEKKFTVLGIVVALLLGLLLAFAKDSCNRGKEEQKRIEESIAKAKAEEAKRIVGTFTAVQLSNEYYNNEVAADADLKGRFIKVTGVVDDIGKTLGDPWITLDIAWQVPLGSPGIRVWFGRGNDDQVINLRKGQKVGVVGKCTGRTLTDVQIQEARIAPK